MTTVLIVLDLVAVITCIASTSRQVWAFARDKGFPFLALPAAREFSKRKKKKNFPPPRLNFSSLLFSFLFLFYSVHVRRLTD